MAFALQYKIKTSGTNKPETPVSPSPNLSPPSSKEHIEMMVTPERKNNRGKIQIMGDVLTLGTSGIKKTHIMYKANLSYEQVHLYLGELIGKRLIEQDVSPEGVVYRTTEKGREFLLHYTRLVELLEEEARQEPEVELSSPYIRASNMGWMR
jgi:predicted transcriptional regulator